MDVDFQVVAERCLDGVKQIRLSRPPPDAPTYRFSLGTEVRVSGNQPTLTDPYETKMVYVGDVPGLGEGVFAKKNIKKGCCWPFNNVLHN